ncbi:hypothetical protein GAO09_15455 [Rhizobiales bacterium RZME27]|uniref:Uncharacterized protein n=1 Tax=Endobacterium cereale TaxID=2663029 RepID=A0A6A8ACJ2_9HYPH|nr:hypothetical protein [Endobacterium cereale]MEB2847155.1 hypothetical protein [Endobacterium cereale]MQY47430.1 hypothetical protein [Endobacterium cereale]
MEYYFVSDKDIFFAAEMADKKSSKGQCATYSWDLQFDPAKVDLPEKLFIFLDAEYPLEPFDFDELRGGILCSQKFVNLLDRFAVKYRKSVIEYIDCGGGGIENAQSTFFIIIDDFINCLDLEQSEIEYFPDRSDFNRENVKCINKIAFKNTGHAFFKSADLPTMNWIATENFKRACEQAAIVNMSFSAQNDVVIARDSLGLLTMSSRPESREQLAMKALAKRRKGRSGSPV